MNKEEMINTLKNLSFNIKTNAETIEDINIDINLLNNDISDLEIKLKDDKNYPTFYYMIDKLAIEDARIDLQSAQSQLDGVANLITSKRLEISKIETQLASCKEALNKSNSEYENLKEESLFNTNVNVEKESEIKNNMTEDKEIQKLAFVYLWGDKIWIILL